MESKPMPAVAAAAQVSNLLYRSGSSLRHFWSWHGCVPEGQPENSPTLQRWLAVRCRVSPEGTLETRPESALMPPRLSRPFGTGFVEALIPTLKRWAILAYPFGIGALRSGRLALHLRP